MTIAPQANSSHTKHLLILFFVTLFLRAITFHSYVRHEERYLQPDTLDYHNSAVCITYGTGMHRPDTHEPIFWRTPGYPVFLACFLNLFGLRGGEFSANHDAHIVALWIQIILSSLLPLLIFALVLLMTGIPIIAWITAWACALHHGFVLASTYILTEALTLIFFVPFLYFLYKALTPCEQRTKNYPWVGSIIASALFLGIATWIRPMGEFMSVVALIVMACFCCAPWKTKLKKMGLFLLIFFAVTCGWYIRNYNLTGSCFFCPMFGPYLNSFSAPKIMRNVHGWTLPKSINTLFRQAEKLEELDRQIAAVNGHVCCPQYSALKVAMPIIKAHPFIFARDWIKEVLKTTFDLYSSQLVGFARNTFQFDPLEEFVTEKWRDCLYATPMPLSMRILVYLEVLFELIKWIGLLLGAWYFLLRRLWNQNTDPYIKKMIRLWLCTGFIIASVVGMTGGFGYARLRLPVEPLMIMLSLTAWYYFFCRSKNSCSFMLN